MNNHVETVQKDLDNLRDMLRSNIPENCSLDANALIEVNIRYFFYISKERKKNFCRNN